MNAFTFYLSLSLLLISLYVNGKSVTVFDNLYKETTIRNRSLPNINAPMTEGLEIRPRVNTIDYPELQDCATQEINRGEYSILDNGNAYIAAFNKILSRTMFQINGETLIMCRLDDLSGFRIESEQNNTFPNCPKWYIEKDEFERLLNGSVLLYDKILQIGSYQLKGDRLLTCIDEDDDYDAYNLTDELPNHAQNKNSTPVMEALILVGQIGASISVFALIMHFLAFAYVPTLRNLPGYNLTSLSVALFMAYLFMLIGQIPQVLGTSCAVSGALQHYFFLASFFWMNVMAFDVWRSLRLATRNLILGSNKVLSVKFLLYSLYAWCLPIFVCIAAAIVQNSSNILEKYKPSFGKKLCFFNEQIAKQIFFGIPALTGFTINSVFLALSAFMIVNSTMKNANEQHTIAKRNFVLYAKLCVIMGTTWLFGILAASIDSIALWFICDILNSLQGLFIFLLFTCSRKVLKYFRKRTSYQSSNSSFKRSFNSTKIELH